MAKSKSTRVRRDDQFERDYLVRMGLVKPATEAPSERAELMAVAHCCQFLLPIAEAQSHAAGSELVATWLKAVFVITNEALANGGYGGRGPHGDTKVDGQLPSSRT